MNIIKGKISHLEIDQQLTLVQVDAEHVSFTTVVIDTPETAHYLQIGHPVSVIFKETEVVLATARAPKISLQNQITGKVSSIQRGHLLSKVQIKTAVGPICSIITTKAVEQLGLQEHSEVVAMIKTNEVMLSA